MTDIPRLPSGKVDRSDSIEDWASRYLDAAVRGGRSAEVADKRSRYTWRGSAITSTTPTVHERLSAAVHREILAWRDHLAGDPPGGLGLAPATVHAHLALLSGSCTWVVAHELAALPHGNPGAMVSDLLLPHWNLDLDQRQPSTPAGLRTAKKAKPNGVRGKARTSRHVLLSADARLAVTDYLWNTSGHVMPHQTRPGCSCPRPRSGPDDPDGRLSPS